MASVSTIVFLNLWIWMLDLPCGISIAKSVNLSNEQFSELLATVKTLQMDVATLKEDKHYLELDIAALLENRDLHRYRMSQIEKKSKKFEQVLKRYKDERKEILEDVNEHFVYYDEQLQGVHETINSCYSLSIFNKKLMNITKENIIVLENNQETFNDRMDLLYNNSVILNSKLDSLVEDSHQEVGPEMTYGNSKRGNNKNVPLPPSGEVTSGYMGALVQWLHIELMSTKLKQLTLMSRLAQLENNRPLNINYTKGSPLMNVTARNSGSRSRKQGINYVNNPPHEVELLAIIDYEAYTTWYEREGGHHTSGRKMRTQEAITKYVTSVIHGMNSIYSTLETHDIKIKVSLVDILIIQTVEGGSWLSKLSNSSSPRNIIMADKALEAFYGWIHKYQRLLPPHDHAMLFTGFDLQSLHETPDRLTTGHAYLGTMCQEASVSVVENQFNFEDVEAASHELGHGLGSEHDGEGNMCSDKDGYLMAPIIEVNATYRWYFSPCSVTYIQDLLDRLTREGRNCLETQDNKGHMPIPPGADVQLGKHKTPDEQCVLIEGPGSFFCRDFYGENDYPTICRNMWCYNVTNSKTKNKQTCNTFLGSDGFVCGNQKVCVRGECVPDSTAPVVLEHCPQGDEQGTVWKNYTCADIVKHVPEQCYDAVTQKKCCASCDSINTGNRECPYGDRSSWCRTRLDLPMGCYNNEELCCETCAKVENTIQQDCPYGDRSTWCNTTLDAPMDCYENEHLCCETCRAFRDIAEPECPYGDKSVWCEKNLTVPYDCYKNSDLCCSTCQKYHKPQNPGCEYGDKSMWCAKEMKSPSGCYLNSDLCCGTCAPHYNVSNVGCEYGDKHSECALVEFPMGCYKNQLLCCGSCRPTKRPDRPGCEFGDKSLWCKTRLRPEQDCDLNMDLCCGTCEYKDALYG